MEDFVTFELAKKLKEKGLELDKIATYNPRTNVRTNHLEPTISQVLKWLRDKKQLFVGLSLFKDGYEAYIQSTNFEEGKDYTDMWIVKGFHQTCEQAVLAGVTYCLENLI